MGFFRGSFQGQSNSQVLRDQMENGLKARAARRAGRRDEGAEAREEAASQEMQSRYREEKTNAEASRLIRHWGRQS